MAIRTPLRPEVIAPTRRLNIDSFRNFISGNQPLGSSIFNSAANNIVNFQRGAKVAPQPSDIGSIIQTLSSNILNNVEGRLQTINQNVSQVVNNTINRLSSNFERKVSDIEFNSPNRLLSEFLKLYDSAIGYIRFFANKDNIIQLGNNLDDLRNVFDETFNVARTVRTQIIRIVDQLNSLPTANAGGSGLNLDVRVPNADVKKNVGNNLPRVNRRNRVLPLLAAGAAGAGSAAVVSALMDVGDQEQVQPVQMETGAGLSGPMLDKFNAILDRFDNAIKNFSEGKGKSKPTGTAPPQQQSQQSGGGGGASPSTGEVSTVSSAPGDEKLAAFVATMEAGSPENAADALQVMLNRAATGGYGKGLPGVLSGYDQFSPISAAIYGRSADARAASIYGPLYSRIPGNNPSEKFKYLQKVASGPNGLKELEKIFGGGSAAVAAEILNNPKYLKSSRSNVRGALNFYGASAPAQAGDLKFRSGGNYFYNFKGKVGTLSQVDPSINQSKVTPVPISQVTPQNIRPASTQSSVARQVATQVAQPPPMQQQPIVNVVPVNLSQGQQSMQPQMISPPTQPRVADNIPMIGSTNPDNFLVLYSKMVYNIVDG